MDFNTTDDILDFAIQREVEAAAMYRRLADEMARPGMQQVFLEFAAEEDRHKERLEKVKAGEVPAVSDDKVQDLKIADYALPPQVSSKMTYPEALRLAMQAEKSAFRLYTTLAERTTDGRMAAVFRSLAQEEAKHKLRFEIEYDEHVLEGM
jgi:rubrerythrin